MFYIPLNIVTFVIQKTGNFKYTGSPSFLRNRDCERSPLLQKMYTTDRMYKSDERKSGGLRM